MSVPKSTPTSAPCIHGLHPQAAAFVQRVQRPDVPAFHALPLASQRQAQEKMLRAFAPVTPQGTEVSEGWIERDPADGGRLRYLLYRSADSPANQPLAAMCWLHGGGGVVGSPEGYDAVCRQLAQGSGCAVLALAYRLAPEHPFPAAVDDSIYALGWMAANACSLGIDAQRLAVGGDSAGGNLATVTALRARDAHGPGLRFQLLVYPDTDKRCVTASHREFAQGLVLTHELLHTFHHHYLTHAGDALDWRASPILAPRLAGLPPALIIAASHDPLRDDGLAYAARLQAEGVAVQYTSYPGMVHNFFSLGGVIDMGNQAVAHAAVALKSAMGSTAG